MTLHRCERQSVESSVMGHIFIEDAEKCFLNKRNITQPWQKEDRLQPQSCMNRTIQGSRDVRGRTGVTASCSQGCLVWKRDERVEDDCCSPRG